MKIFLLNYRYFVSGGPERYMFNIKEVLEQHGHEVIPFSVKHNKNQPTKYTDYFLDPIGTGDEVYGHEYKRTFKTSLKVVARIIYSFEAKNKLKKAIKDLQPDLIYVLHFQNKMSCSVIDAAREMKVPIIQRISDFGHICQNANASFYLYSKNEICEKCLHGSFFNNVKNKCVDNSFSHSMIKATSLGLMQFLDIKDKIDAFVFPSSFTMAKYVEFGVKDTKVNHIPTFFNKSLINETEIEYGDYAVFIGRLVPEKGLNTLVKAFAGTSFKLKIIGNSADGLMETELKTYLKDQHHAIEFLGEMNFNEIQKYLRGCLFTIVPSEWYENQPNTILESYAFKKCVVATNIGSLKEIVRNEETGLLFEYKDFEDLRKKVEILFNNQVTAKKYGELAFEKINTIYSSKNHYELLIDLFEKVISSFKKQ
jgi:glycosyltransferase involved in cell wall biosynthesis